MQEYRIRHPARLSTGDYTYTIAMFAHHERVAVGYAHARSFGQTHVIDECSVGAAGISQQYVHSVVVLTYFDDGLTTAHEMLRVVEQHIGSRCGCAATDHVFAGMQVVLFSGEGVFEGHRRRHLRRRRGHGVSGGCRSGYGLLHRHALRLGLRRLGTQLDEIAHTTLEMTMRTHDRRRLVIGEGFEGQHFGTVLIGASDVYFRWIGCHSICLDVGLNKVRNVNIVIEVCHIDIVVREVLILSHFVGSVFLRGNGSGTLLHLCLNVADGDIVR